MENFTFIVFNQQLVKSTAAYDQILTKLKQRMYQNI